MEDTACELTADCIARHGTKGFTQPFLALAQCAGAEQVMIFSYRPDHAACLMARNFVEGAKGDRLAAQYLDGWFRDDPLYRQALELSQGALKQFQLEELRAAIPPEYHEQFFAAPGIGSKQAVTVAGAQLRLGVNLYARPGQQADAGLARLLARLALLHFEAAGHSDEPPALSVLSERERQVCLGILQGKKAEIIAHDLNIGATSVVTYRRRAYEKLGITSRASLFALCRP